MTSSTSAAGRTASKRPSRRTSLAKGPALWRRLWPTGAALLAVCGGYQLLGRGYRGRDGSFMPGVGLFPHETVAGKTRMIGDVLLECELVPGCGGRSQVREPRRRTLLDEGRSRSDASCTASGTTANRDSRAAAWRAIGTYLHGPCCPGTRGSPTGSRAGVAHATNGGPRSSTSSRTSLPPRRTASPRSGQRLTATPLRPKPRRAEDFWLAAHCVRRDAVCTHELRSHDIESDHRSITNTDTKNAAPPCRCVEHLRAVDDAFGVDRLPFQCARHLAHLGQTARRLVPVLPVHDSGHVCRVPLSVEGSTSRPASRLPRSIAPEASRTRAPSVFARCRVRRQPFSSANTLRLDRGRTRRAYSGSRRLGFQRSRRPVEGRLGPTASDAGTAFPAVFCTGQPRNTSHAASPRARVSQADL